MIEMSIEQLTTFASVCGMYENIFQSISDTEFSLLLKRIPKTKYLAYCLEGIESVTLGNELINYRYNHPDFRIIAIGNREWYRLLSNSAQSIICEQIEHADIFVRCTFPLEDARRFVMLCSDYCLMKKTNSKKLTLIKTV